MWSDFSDVSPIVVRPTSAEQRQWLEDYAIVKGHASVESWALHALDTATLKEPLTGARLGLYERIVAEREKIEQR